MNLDGVTLKMLSRGVVLKVVNDRPFISMPGQHCVDAYAGETVVFLSYVVYQNNVVHMYFLHRGVIVREGASLRHNANDVHLALEACLDDMEEI